MNAMSCVEVCAGGGGQALGLERAGFQHIGLIDADYNALATLRLNRPNWPVIAADLKSFDARTYRQGVSLLAGGVPCPPFSSAGRQLGQADDRNLFPDLLRLVEEIQPNSIMVENVPALATSRFAGYLAQMRTRLERDLGFLSDFRVIRAADFGVPQLRPRLVIVAMRPDAFARFAWPAGFTPRSTVGEALFDLMAEAGWPHAAEWRDFATGVAPTLVGGSRRHGGPDLGPSRARQQWRRFCIDGRSIADEPPPRDLPHFMQSETALRLTLKMVARLQGFPDQWKFAGRKTRAYRQIGNAFPPPVAEAVGRQISLALRGG
jgi:DNA (cytosine-5)-methyltransferase 1